MKYKAVLFDLDGTLMETIGDLADSLNYSLRINGFPERSLSEVRQFVGNGLHSLVERALPTNAKKESIETCYRSMAQYYKAHSMVKSKPYDGVQNLLLELDQLGVKTAIITNKIQTSADDIARKYFQIVSCVVGDSGLYPLKPAPDGALLALNKLGVAANDAILVGDSEVDLATAQNAGIDFIAVLWGFRSRQVLCEKGASCFAETCAQLREFIL